MNDEIVFIAPKNSWGESYKTEFTAAEIEKIRNSFDKGKSYREITRESNMSSTGIHILLFSEPHWVMKDEPFYLTDDDLIYGPKIDYNELSTEEKNAYEKVEQEYWKKQ